MEREEEKAKKNDQETEEGKEGQRQMEEKKVFKFRKNLPSVAIPDC
jgi:hypothetical protein